MAPDDPATGRLSVLVADERGRRLPASGLVSWLRRVAPAAARGTVSIALVSDARVRALNRTYRRKDYATDVLTFSYCAWGPTPTRARSSFDETQDDPERVEGSAAPLRGAPLRRLALAAGALRGTEPSDLFLGEIVIARGVARRQARNARHSELTEHKVLALHGLLHLLGYDHERDNGRMHRVERRLRKKGGLDEGLIERAGAPAPLKKRLRPSRDEDRQTRGEGSASARAGGGAPAPLRI
jgi:ssRNA-specific RNase YbeY (16S rRNA maturation enzyme)